MADRSVLVPMTFSDLERRHMMGQIFRADLLNNIARIPFDLE